MEIKVRGKVSEVFGGQQSLKTIFAGIKPKTSAKEIWQKIRREEKALQVQLHK